MELSKLLKKKITLKIYPVKKYFGIDNQDILKYTVYAYYKNFFGRTKSICLNEFYVDIYNSESALKLAKNYMNNFPDSEIRILKEQSALTRVVEPCKNSDLAGSVAIVDDRKT